MTGPHELAVTTEVHRLGNRFWPESGESAKPRREVRCTCGWWEILHGESAEQIQAMHDRAQA